MKKIIYCMIILLIMVTFVGCANRIELTDDETDMFAEYISNEVLKYDKYYDNDLLEPENVLVDDEDEEEVNIDSSMATESDFVATNVDYSDSKTDTNDEITLNDILGTSAIEVSYQSAKVYDSYPKAGNSYFVIESSKGYKLLVVTFELKNRLAKDVTYSMLTKDVNYKLTMENKSSYSPLLTLLVDDLQFVNKVIPKESTQEGILVFRIAESEAKSKATLEVGCKEQSMTLKIK